MPPKSAGMLWLLLIFFAFERVSSTDVFCGQLSVFKQQWFDRNTQTLGARMATDLCDCLNSCCGISACNAVTFLGFLNDIPSPTANCVMFQCDSSGCSTVSEPIANEGVEASNFVNMTFDSLSTNRSDDKVQSNTSSDSSTAAPTVVFDDKEEDDEKDVSATPSMTNPPASTGPTRIIITPPIRPTPNRGTPPTAEPTPDSSTIASASFLAELTPIWVVGIAIVILVVCLGISMTVISIWLCYRRQKAKMRSVPISIKAPALSAFNPPSIQTASMH
ncbi:hypothetical protein M3Y94_00594800 [Aphelenchoides besseyi]|nr:hypothetical protein M3Y94_00594800 [Aphelenchoides besseyi]